MPLEVEQEIWRQIPIGVKMRLGMRDARIIDGALEMRVGPLRPQRKVVICLNMWDLYNVELYKLKPGPIGEKSFVTWELEDCYDSVSVYDLGEVLIWMEGKNWG